MKKGKDAMIFLG